MELTQHSLLEEFIMAPKIDTPFPNEYFQNNWNFTTPSHEYQTPDLHNPLPNNPSFLELISPSELNNNYPYSYGEFEFQPFLDALTSPEFGSFYDPDDPSPMAIQDHQEYAANLDNYMINNNNGFVGEITSCNKIDYCPQTDSIIADQNMDNVINVGLCGERKSKSKKPDGMPSKNLMAERRRRKRLNDRLSMLRSIVPKISKMDRTSILGDTIDYMRELLDKIHKLRGEGVADDENTNRVDPIGLKELRKNDAQVRNPPKFDVERREEDTKVEVCCTAKPRLLLSTLGTLDVLGLDIQQCVISCFNDFSLQASCYEVVENRSIASPEDVKQALFRNAGYGGRCL